MTAFSIKKTVDFNKMLQYIRYRGLRQALDILFEVLHNDDSAYTRVPDEIFSDDQFMKLLTEQYSKRTFELSTNIESRILLISNIISKKKWQDFQYDNGILFELSCLRRKIPNDPRLTFAYAQFYFLSGLFMSALSFIDKLESHFAGDVSADVLLIKIKCYLEMGMDDKIELFFAELPEEKQSAALLSLEAQWRREQGDYGKGIEAAKKALLIDPQCVSAIFEMGANLFYSGNKSEAEEVFEPLLSMADSDPAARHYACLIHTLMGNRDAALELVESILKESSAEAYLTAARVYAMTREFDRACECLGQAMDKGYVSNICLWNDCAFHELRETEEGAKTMGIVYGRWRLFDFQEMLSINL